MNILKYNNYEGTAELDMESKICRGKILFINDLVTYQSPDPNTLQEAFEAAVNDYLETCEYLERKPQKPLKGSFSVRVSPSLHKTAVIRAKKDNTSLNKIVARALESYISGTTEVANNFTIHMQAPKDLTTFTASASQSDESTVWGEYTQHVQ